MSEKTPDWPLKEAIFCGRGWSSRAGRLTSPKFTPKDSHQTDSHLQNRHDIHNIETARSSPIIGIMLSADSQPAPGNRQAIGI